MKAVIDEDLDTVSALLMAGANTEDKTQVSSITFPQGQQPFYPLIPHTIMNRGAEMSDLENRKEICEVIGPVRFPGRGYSSHMVCTNWKGGYRSRAAEGWCQHRSCK